MSNYSDNTSSCRVDFFKESGKWYCTEAVEWKTYKGSPRDGGKLIYDAFAEALVAHLRDPKTGNVRLSEMTAVCLDPYHEQAHPLMMKVEHAVNRSDFIDPLLPRTPDGDINNCALANGDEERNCQMCRAACPDRSKFKS